MAGTKAGAKKASKTVRRRYGDDFYKRIGKVGGQNGRTGGFASNRGLARIAGAKGGRISRRGKNKVKRPPWSLLVNWRRIVKDYLYDHAEDIAYEAIDTAYSKGVGVEALCNADTVVARSIGNLADFIVDRIIDEVDTTNGEYEPSERVYGQLLDIAVTCLSSFLTSPRQNKLFWQAYLEFKEVQERDDG